MTALPRTWWTPGITSASSVKSPCTGLTSTVMRMCRTWMQSPATLGRIRYIIKNRFTNRYPRHKLADDDVLDSLDAGSR
ncbi:hypothetical protein [Escherichia coli]|uniref:hypothetical protein n=1 Tax=Escherichia coli TaxID=562 RepID=UPI002FCCE97A